MRSSAKALNFGIIYGMGSTSFAASAGISRDEAKRFIEEYFREFAQLKAFLEETKEKARENGFVETLFGRRRAFSDLESLKPQIRAQAERMAINFPIQGLEADIMKKAMINVSAQLKAQSRSAGLLLQVHDQLLFEMPQDEKKLIPEIRHIMESVIDLAVPLKVDIKEGIHWGEF